MAFHGNSTPIPQMKNMIHILFLLSATSSYKATICSWSSSSFGKCEPCYVDIRFGGVSSFLKYESRFAVGSLYLNDPPWPVGDSIALASSPESDC